MNYINKEFNKKFTFYKVPKIILKEPYKKLSSNAKLCYMLLLDRINLSKMNNIEDEYGNIYIYYTRENMQKELRISKSTAIKVFNELVDSNLISQIKDRYSYKIYLYDIFNDNYKVEKLDRLGINSIPSKVQNLYLNKNIYNNNYKNRFAQYEQRQYPEGFFDQFYANLK